MAPERGDVQERTDTAPAQPGPQRPAAAPTVRWDDADLKSSYANVCNVSSTREEVVLSFGINQAWERGQTEVKVQLSHRIILSPFVAKRLADLLNNVVREYEARFGPLQAEGRRPGEP